MPRPNILWICTDQQRWDTLSCRGHAGAATPNLDRLAAGGVVFDRAYAQSTICTPSRASFLTGMYPIAHQIHRNGNIGFPDHLTLVPQLFQEAGYHTGLVGKLHLSRSEGIIECRPARDGYKEFFWSHHPYPDWDEGNDYQDWLVAKGVDPSDLFKSVRVYGPGVPADLHQTTWAGDRARSFIERNRDKPWFLSINVFDPHPPFDPPAEYLAGFKPSEMPAPAFQPSDLVHQERFHAVDFKPSKLAESTVLQSVPRITPASYDAKYIRACYHAMIALIDDMVGDLVSALIETDQLNETLVIFTSDHGEMLGDHGLLYKGCRFYDGLVRVPLIFSWPGTFLEGAVSEALVELIDIPLTLLDAVSLPTPSSMQGKSLFSLLRGVAPLNEHKPYVLSEYSDAVTYEGSKGSRASMYFDGHFKLNVYHDAGEGELFNATKDPNEFNDLWSDPNHNDVRAELLRRHFDAMMSISGGGPPRSGLY